MMNFVSFGANATKFAMQSPEAERNGPSKELLDRLRAEEIGKKHFTYIVLTLRDQHVEVGGLFVFSCWNPLDPLESLL